MKNWKKYLVIGLAACTLLQSMPVYAFAEKAAAPQDNTLQEAMISDEMPGDAADAVLGADTGIDLIEEENGSGTPKDVPADGILEGTSADGTPEGTPGEETLVDVSVDETLADMPTDETIRLEETDAGNSKEESDAPDLKEAAEAEEEAILEALTLTGEGVVNEAVKYINKCHYVWGGNSLSNSATTGSDCSGFACAIYEKFGVDLWANRSSIRNSSKVTNKGTDLANAKAGDILWFDGHIGIYAGKVNGYHMMVNQTGGNVKNVRYQRINECGSEFKGILRVNGITYTGATLPVPEITPYFSSHKLASTTSTSATTASATFTGNVLVETKANTSTKVTEVGVIAIAANASDPNPTISNYSFIQKKTGTNLTGSQSITLTGLAATTKYNYRMYMKTNKGTVIYSYQPNPSGTHLKFNADFDTFTSAGVTCSFTNDSVSVTSYNATISTKVTTSATVNFTKIGLHINDKNGASVCFKDRDYVATGTGTTASFNIKKDLGSYLKPNTEYTYCFVAIFNGKTVWGAKKPFKTGAGVKWTFSGDTVSPTSNNAVITTKISASETVDFAKIGLHINDLKGNSVVWKDRGYTATASGTTASFNIKNDLGSYLQPNTTYTYCFAVTYNGGVIAWGPKVQFTTSKATTPNPTVTPTPTPKPTTPTPTPTKPAANTSVVSMYRMYNPNSGEHFYTADAGEKNSLVRFGWNYEGIGWKAPKTSNEPVYRLYNPNAGDHHYTRSAAEKNGLVKIGWQYEGIGWYSDAAKGVPLYRQYNPNAVTGSHNYTTSKKENDMLVSIGWKAEGIGWYGVK